MNEYQAWIRIVSLENEYLSEDLQLESLFLKD